MTIHIKKKNIGKFTAYKKRTGKTTSEALHSKDPHVRQMANFARNVKKWKHPEGGVVEGAIGGIGGGIPGMMLGILTGALNQQKQQEMQNSMITRQKQQEQMQGNASLLMAQGGLTPDGTPIEVEDGEVMRGNDDSLAEVSGPTHAEGGIDVIAEPGTQIFGKLKIKDGPYAGLEYKEAASRIRKKIAHLERIKNK